MPLELERLQPPQQGRRLANTSSTEISSTMECKNAETNSTERGRSPAQVPFLFVSKLHDMLRDCDDDPEGKGSVVSWLPDGKAFRVHNKNLFVETILPIYFKQTKYKSFQRQLNLWGFDRITNDTLVKGAYFHKHFVRGEPLIIHKMRRIRAIKKIPAKERRRREALLRLDLGREGDLTNVTVKSRETTHETKSEGTSTCGTSQDGLLKKNLTTLILMDLDSCNRCDISLAFPSKKEERMPCTTEVTVCNNSYASNEDEARNQNTAHIIDRCISEEMSDGVLIGEYHFSKSDMRVASDEEDDAVSLLTSASSFSLLDNLFSLDEN